jgi:NADH-quinone oxidoreductase subunit N
MRASEAGLKYFVLGALSSGMLLYGASLLYGFAGTVSFTGIATAIGSNASLGVTFGLVFVMAGLAFKISAVPFHMWTPDVYEGAPTPVTAFFASAVKMAAVAITLRVVITVFEGIPGQWRQLVTFISILSMALGAFAAIGQANIKRLMAYSAIGHIGYALVGLAAGGEMGVSSVLAYMAIYLVMTLGTFAGILLMRVDGQNVENIADLSGLARTDGVMAFFLATMMFSLAGVPPLAGFFAKWYVFNAAIQAGLYPLAVIGVLSSAVAAYYYLRIVKVMYFDEPAPAFDRPAPAPRAVLAATGVLVVFLFAYPGLFIEATRAAASSLF